MTNARALRALAVDHILPLVLVILLIASGRGWAQTRAEQVWSTPQRLQFLGDSCSLDACPSLSPSGDTLFFEHNSLIYWVTRAAGVWGTPAQFMPSAGIHLCRNPSLSFDGNHLYFSHYGNWSWDLFECMKDSMGTWGQPKQLGPTINGPAHEVYAFEASDHHLYVQRDSTGDLLERASWDDSTGTWGPLVDLIYDPQTALICVPNNYVSWLGGFSFSPGMQQLYLSAQVVVDNHFGFRLFHCTFDSVSKKWCTLNCTL